MSLFKKIRDDKMAAMRARDSIRLNLLRTIETEAAAYGKADGEGNREPTDSEVVSVLKKGIKNVQSTFSLAEEAGVEIQNPEKLNAEISILKEYLPEQLEGDALRKHIEYVMDMKCGNNIGLVMKELISQFGENFNKREASQMAAQLIKERN